MYKKIIYINIYHLLECACADERMSAKVACLKPMPFSQKFN